MLGIFKTVSLRKQGMNIHKNLSQTYHNSDDLILKSQYKNDEIKPFQQNFK